VADLLDQRGTINQRERAAFARDAKRDRPIPCPAPVTTAILPAKRPA